MWNEHLRIFYLEFTGEGPKKTFGSNCTKMIVKAAGTNDITRQYWLPCRCHPQWFHSPVFVGSHRQLWSNHIHMLLSRVVFLFQGTHAYHLIPMHSVLKCLLVLAPFPALSKAMKTGKRSKPWMPPWEHWLLHGAHHWSWGVSQKKRKAAEIEEECVYHEGLEKTEFPEGGRSQECWMCQWARMTGTVLIPVASLGNRDSFSKHPHQQVYGRCQERMREGWGWFRGEEEALRLKEWC